MALAKKCDRCGEIYDPYGSNSEFNAIIPAYIDTSGFAVKKFRVIDLCPKCRKSFKEWLNGGK